MFCQAQAPTKEGLDGVERTRKIRRTATKKREAVFKNRGGHGGACGAGTTPISRTRSGRPLAWCELASTRHSVHGRASGREPEPRNRRASAGPSNISSGRRSGYRQWPGRNHGCCPERGANGSPVPAQSAAPGSFPSCEPAPVPYPGPPRLRT